jgi:hypothetical protein
MADLKITQLAENLDITATDLLVMIDDVAGTPTTKKITFATFEGDIDHDALTNFVANEHIDWTSNGAGTIHSSNYTNTTYTASTGITLTGTAFSTNDSQINHNSLSNTHNLTTDIDHDALTNFVANEHIDWTGASAGTIHATNYTNTTYSAGTGITLTGTTFSTNDGAIVHDSLSGVHQAVGTSSSPSFVSVLLPFTNLGNLGATETVNFNTYTNARGTLDSAVTITISNVTDGQRCGLTLYYSGAQRAITWAGVDYWVGGVPTAPSSGEVLVVTFINDGSKVIGSGELATEVVA